tara:strand:- start:370 stop:510 length:141 start_codon:yes stop_codon:yes gene_type:complete
MVNHRLFPNNLLGHVTVDLQTPLVFFVPSPGVMPFMMVAIVADVDG